MKSVVKLTKQFLLVISIMNFSFIYAQEINKEVSVEEYVSSLDKYDYQKYIERSDKNFLIRDIGNTGAFLSEIVNMGNRKYSFAYVVYILPDQKNEVIRDLSKRTVYSFEKWKIWEKENEIKRRKEGVSLADTLLKLKSTSNEILEKYKYHTTENNRKLALGIILGTLRNAILIKSGDFKSTVADYWKADQFNRRSFIQNYRTSDGKDLAKIILPNSDPDSQLKNEINASDTSNYTILPDNEFLKLLNSPFDENITFPYKFSVDILKKGKKIFTVQVFLYDVNKDWGELTLQIQCMPFRLDMSSLNEELAELIVKEEEINEYLKILEAKYNKESLVDLKNQIKNVENIKKEINDRVNELSESELNHFKYGSSFCFLTEPGIFEDCKDCKDWADGGKLLELNYNPTTLGKLDLYKIKFMENIVDQEKKLNIKLKKELINYVENEEILNNFVDKCSFYIWQEVLKYYLDIIDTDKRSIIFKRKIVRGKGNNFQETVKIIKNKKSYLELIVNGNRDEYGDFYIKFDFKNMKMEQYNSFYDKIPTASIDLN